MQCTTETEISAEISVGLGRNISAEISVNPPKLPKRRKCRFFCLNHTIWYFSSKFANFKFQYTICFILVIKQWYFYEKSSRHVSLSCFKKYKESFAFYVIIVFGRFWPKLGQNLWQVSAEISVMVTEISVSAETDFSRFGRSLFL